MFSSNTKPKILVAEDEPDTLEIIKIGLEFQDYNVICAKNGEEALLKIQDNLPDLAILDVMMPKIDGLEVCRQIKSNFFTSHIPIIMLTARGQVEDKVSGINFGADDYMIKPFDMRELVARVEMILRRTKLSLEASPLTGLPGNIAIQREIEKRINNKEIFAVCYMDLDNFKAYNDRYGHISGDSVIKATADIITKVCKINNEKNNFVGHIGGDDFVCIVTPSMAEEICEEIIDIFDKEIVSFYNEIDKKRGYIHSVDRLGKRQKFPLITISIGIVTNEKRTIAHHGQVAQITAELKKFAKSFKGSIFVKDRRKDDEIKFIDSEEVLDK